MTLFVISFIAGVLTVLAPCILPLLPVIIGSSVGARSKATPYIVIGSLALSILLFTYLLKASTVLITIPPYVWSYFSGGILFGFGLILLFPMLWERLPFIAKGSTKANKLVGIGHQKKSIWGDVLIGAALGPVFSTCSPTYFVILATVLPASFLLGTAYLLTYIAGLVVVLLLIAVLGQRLTARLQIAADSHGLFKKIIGLLFIAVGIFIITGYDKKLETWVLQSGYFNITIVEQKLLDSLDNTSPSEPTTTEPVSDANIPAHLVRLFPQTDWSRVDPRLADALSGGPTRDGIPAIDNPRFSPIQTFTRPDTIQAIVLFGENEVRVYPYHILTWHEIVNDTIDDTPVAVTFCPLCGSAIVYDRTLPDGSVSTFGVSGSLLESNMIMYDRNTENLWQQSTGKTLAGSWHENQLTLVPFQLMTVGDIKQQHPDALILTEPTANARDYGRNPYAGYEDDDRFVFNPTLEDDTFPPKTIMAVFSAAGVPAAVPWLALREKQTHQETISGETYTLTVSDSGTLSITDTGGTTLPFYFEMWFSFAAQHGSDQNVISI